MTFSIIGTGNTAWFLASRLTEAGHTCAGIYGRNRNAAEELANTVNTHAISNLSDIEETDCCIIAISDHAIADITAELSFKNTVLLHTAGSVSLDVLKNASVHHGVIWPIYSIVKTSLPQHRSIPMVWEGNTPHAQQIIEILVDSLSDVSYMLSSEQRNWLHLSAVLSNNFSNHLLAICEQLCKEHNVPFNLLYPILLQTTERVQTQSPRELQTGPAKRADEIVINKHMDMLGNKPEWQEVYKAISASIQKMYKQG